MLRRGITWIVVGLTLWTVLPTPASAGTDSLSAVFVSGVERIPLNRVVGRDNRDPNWDWTLNTTYTLQTHSQTFTGVRLPYYSNSGPAAVLLNDSTGRDIYPADGWELVLRDFGPVPIPFFILYNKYRGILRVFFFSTLQSTFSSAVGRLTFQSTSTARTGAHFTLSEKTVFLDNYNPARAQVVVGAIQPQQWGFFDFDVSGYDPGIATKDDPTFVFEITGVTQSDLTATGTVNLTTGPVSANTNMRPGSSFIDSAFSVIDNVNKRHASVKKFRETIDQQVDASSGAWWAAPLRAIRSLTTKSWFLSLGPVAGFLDFVLGGGSSKSTLPFPLATEGTVSLRGEISTQTAVYDLIFRAPGSRHLTPVIDADSNVLPLYDVPLGVFNVTTRPAFDITVTSDLIQIIPTCPWNIDVQSHATKNLQVTYNTQIFSSADIRVTWAPWIYPARRFVTVSSFNSGWTDFFSGDGNDADLYIDLISGAYFAQRIAVKATLTPSGAAPGVEPVTLYKTYDVGANVINQYTGFGLCESGPFLRLPGNEAPETAAAAGSVGSRAEARLRWVEENRAARQWEPPAVWEDYVAETLDLLLERGALGGPGAGERPEQILDDVRYELRQRLAEGAWGELSDGDLRLLEAAALQTLAAGQGDLPGEGEPEVSEPLLERTF